MSRARRNSGDQLVDFDNEISSAHEYLLTIDGKSYPLTFGSTLVGEPEVMQSFSVGVDDCFPPE